MSVRAPIGSAVALAVLALAACGGNSDDGQPEAPVEGAGGSPYAFVDEGMLTCPPAARLAKALPVEVVSEEEGSERCRYAERGNEEGLVVILDTSGNYDSESDVEAAREVLEGEGASCALYDHPSGSPALDCAAAEEHEGHGHGGGSEGEVNSAEVFIDPGQDPWVVLGVSGLDEGGWSLPQVTLARDELLRELER